MSDLLINAALTIPSAEIEILCARSSGPGGQNVNKVNSKVTLRWSPTSCGALPEAWKKRFVARFRTRINKEGRIVLHSEKYRDRPRNVQAVRMRLVEMLQQTQYAPKKRRLTKPTKGSQRRRLDNKSKHSQKKQNRRKDFRSE